MADDATPRPADALPGASAPGATPGPRPRPGSAPDPEVTEVTRTVELDADADDVWRAVSDPAERSLWLDDPDAAPRRVRVDESAPGERLVWTWWHPGDEGDASTVTVVLQPVVGGGTRVVVTEALPAPVPVVRAAGAAVGASPGTAGRVPPRRAPAWLRCAHDRWDTRVLGLELLFVAARAGVA